MRKTYLLFVALLVSISLQSQTCQTSDATANYTSDPGFEDWIFEGSGNFIGHSTSNGPGSDNNFDNDISTITSIGLITPFSYGLSANLGPSAMIRHFSADLEVGDTFNIKMDNGFNDGGITAFQLRNSSDEFLLNFRISLSSASNYQIIDDGEVDTGIPITYGGLAISITLTAVNSYDMEVTVLETGLIYSHSGNLRTRLGGQSINNVRMFNTVAGFTAQDVFFNSLEICRQQAGVITPDLATLPEITEQCQSLPTAPTANNGAITATANTVFPITTQGTTQIAWTFDDGNGNNFYQTQNVIIDDTLGPTPDLLSLPDITGDCEVTSLTPPTATDNCTGNIIVTNDAVIPITGEGTTTVVTWTYDDGNGNTTIQTQNVILSTVSSLSCTNLIAPNDPGLCEADLVITPPSINESCTTLSNGLGFNGGFFNKVNVPNFPFQLNFTLEAWVNPIVAPVNAYRSVISRGAVFEDNTNYTFGFRHNGIDEYRLFFTMYNGSTIQNHEINLNGSPEGAWSHMAATYDSETKELIIYWNGVLLGSTVFTLNPTDGGQNLILGYPNTNTSTDEGYIGDMDEVRIWDRVLPPTEITSSYNRRLLGTEPGLLAYYKMEDGSPNTTTLDSSGNGYTGIFASTIFGPTWITSEAPVSSIALTNNITNTSDASGIYTVGDTTITWTATDAQGNTNICDAIVTVTDNLAPVPDLADLPDVNAACEVTSLTAPTATDCSSITVTNDASLPITTLGTTVVTWTFDDGNDNTTTQTQNIVLSGPILTDLPDVNATCEVTSLTAPTATDCSSITVTNDASLPITTLGTTVVTWTFDDGNDNTTTQTQNIVLSGPITLYADTDNDGYGDPNNTIQSCVPFSGYVEDNTDCDDTNAYVYLDATEIGDGLDNNCDGLIDNTICFTSNACNDIGDPYIYPDMLFALEYASSNDSGFGPWDVGGSHVLWSSNTNSGGSENFMDCPANDTRGDISWGFIGPSGSWSRTFDSPLGIGDTFSMDLDHGIDVFPLYNRFEINFGNVFSFFYLEGSSYKYYINDRSMIDNWGVYDGSINIFIERESATNFVVAISSLNYGETSFIPVTLSGQQHDLDISFVEFNIIGNSLLSSDIESVYYMNNFEICHNPSTIDEDNDGYAIDADCDDNDATINPYALEICDGKDNDCNGLIDDNVNANGLEITWNGSVSSDWNDPNNWTPSIVPFICSEITIPATSNPPLMTGETTIRHLNISNGSSLLVPVAATLNVSGDLNMYSASNAYSGVVANGTLSIAGTAKYHRYTNAQLNGNDLVAPPLSGQSWSSFLTNDSDYNAAILFNNGVAVPNTTYLFGPFEKGSTDDYLLYNYNTTATLASGQGYRVATNTPLVEGNGEPLIFTGVIETGSVDKTILNDVTGSFAEWNLIGNPYPAYIDVDVFLNHVGSVSGVTNLSLLDDDTAAIYGYNADQAEVSGSIWTVTNLMEGPALIAPGQGFFVSSNLTTATLEFTTDMQVVGATDDFIQGRTTATDYIKLIANTSTKSYSTSLYFHENGTTNLDIGYDAAVFGGSAGNFAIYSHLVDGNEGLPMVIQTLNTSDVNAVIIPIGLHANAGEQVAISLGNFNLPSTVNVYLEDKSTNTFTLLNTSAYNFTTTSVLNGTGRFFIHFSADVLATEDTSFSGINIYTNQKERTIIIDATLVNKTQASIFDVLGRKVKQFDLDTALHENVVDASSLSSGVYVIKLKDNYRSYTQKIILK